MATDDYIAKATRHIYVDMKGQISRTKQSDKDESDINRIVARWLRTGQAPLPTREAHYGDFSNATDFATARQAVLDAELEFAKLPANVRAQFNHNPAELLAFADDPANAEQLADLGVAQPAQTVPETPATTEEQTDPNPPTTNPIVGGE